ncbi:MAG: TolC family protein [Planctomycetia bacterium]|nr:TolC family protein [Planctomycetia bacterium]
MSTQLVTRTGLELGPPSCPGQFALPNGSSLQDGLSEDEAVVIALWNNALFNELLADLNVARGDLVQAGLLPNPEVVYFVPVNDKPFKYALDFPLESLWLRPIRVRAAARESSRVSQRLTQSGLDLIRDARQGFADALLAQGRLEVARQSAAMRGEILRVAEARLQAGDISVQETVTARIDMLRARQELSRAGFDVALAEERLRNLLGVGDDRSPLRLIAAPLPPLLRLHADTLVAEATSTRPDVMSANQNVAAAAERVRLSRVGWVRFLGILDATSGTRTGHEFGPALRMTLPIFNWNEGLIIRAEAELERARRQRQTVHNQVVMEVYQAHARVEQARAELDVLDRQVLVEAERSRTRAEGAFREGDTAYIIVLETIRQVLDSRLRQQQLHADLRRAWADLERSVGRRLTAEPLPPPAAPLPPPQTP